MTIKASGSSLSFTEIYNEFGLPPGKNLGAYRLNGGQTVSGLTLPLDTGIPTSGAIKFSDFYDKKLNVVVDCTPPPGTVSGKVNARDLYTAGTNVTVIGGLIGKPQTPSNIKVWIHTNGYMGATQAVSRTYCTLFTGSWDATIDLRIDIGPSGIVMGGGGAAGLPGSSAIGIIPTNNVVVTNRSSFGSVALLPGGGGGGKGGQGGDGRYTTGRVGLTGVDTVGGTGGNGGWGLGYNTSTLPASAFQGRPGNPSTSRPNPFGVTNAGTGGRGGAGGTWATAGLTGATGQSGTYNQTGRQPQTRPGRPGLPGGAGGYNYVVSNNGTGVSGLSGPIAYTTIPT
jgi:hypothetical protein